MPASESSDVQTYVVAVRRERRHDVPADWVDRVRDCEEVVVQQPVSARRILVQASPAAPTPSVRACPPTCSSKP